MNRRRLIQNLRERPRMFALDGSYVMYIAFLYSYRQGSGDDLLAKLKNKLVDDLGTGQNLGWESLLLRKVAPNNPQLWQPLSPREESFDRRVCEALFESLEDLLRDA